MANIVLGQKMFWPQRAVGQQSQTPDIVYEWMGDGTVGAPTHDITRLHGRIVWADGATHTPSKVYVRVGSVVVNLSANGGQITAALRARGATVVDDTGTLYGSATVTGDLTASAINSITLGSTAALPNKTRVFLRLETTTAYQRWELGYVETDEANHYPGAFTASASSPSSISGKAAVPLILFEAGDGTFGALEDCPFFTSSDPLSSFKRDGVASDGINEHGVRFSVPNESQVIGVFVAGSVNSGVTGYKVAIASLNGSNVPTTPVYEATHTRVDWGSAGTTQARPGFIYFDTPVTLAASQNYALTVRNISTGTGATETMTVQSVVLGNANYALPQQLGQTYSAIKRAGGTAAFDTATAYTVETDRWNNMGVIIDQINTVSEGGGGNGATAVIGGGFGG